MSRIPRILVFAGAVALSAAGVHAQAPEGTQNSAPAIDPTKLGVSFDHIRIELMQPAPPKGKTLKIQETINVVGKSPPVLFWDPRTVKANLTSAAVPYGAPTQKDIMKLIVPKEFQNYPIDMIALTQWLMEHLNKKSE